MIDKAANKATRISTFRIRKMESISLIFITFNLEFGKNSSHSFACCIINAEMRREREEIDWWTVTTLSIRINDNDDENSRWWRRNDELFHYWADIISIIEITSIGRILSIGVERVYLSRGTWDDFSAFKSNQWCEG